MIFSLKVCNFCQGTGMGQYPGNRCTECKGKGKK